VTKLIRNKRAVRHIHVNTVDDEKQRDILLGYLTDVSTVGAVGSALALSHDIGAHLLSSCMFILFPNTSVSPSIIPP
jgi:hypothetical protein